MANLLSDEVKTVNDTQQDGTKCWDEQDGKCNLTGCLKIISVLSTGQEGDPWLSTFPGLHIQLIAQLTVLPFAGNFIDSEGFSYHQMLKMWHLCPGPGQAPKLNLFDPELNILTPQTIPPLIISWCSSASTWTLSHP